MRKVPRTHSYYLNVFQQMIDSIRVFARRAKRTVKGDTIDRPAFFLHIPKCGGASIRAALRLAFGLRSGIQVDLRGNVHHDAFFRLDSAASKKVADQLGVPLYEHREQVLLYQMGNRYNTKKLISGHFLFSEVAYQEHHDTYAFITLLRDPVERWYSNYFYNRDKDSDHFAVEDSLADCIESSRGRFMGSLITRSLAGTNCEEESMVARAIENVAKFDVVGVLEDLGKFKSDVRDLLGASIDIPVRNTSPTPAHQRGKEITPEIHRKVVELCQPDQVVYDYVVTNVLSTSRTA